MKLQSERGNVILVFVVLLFVLALEMLYFFTSHTSNSQKNERRLSVHSDLQQALVLTSAHLSSHLSNINTVYSPLNNTAPEFRLQNCFNRADFDCPNTTNNLSIVDESGSIFVNAMDPSHGLRMNLETCNTFDVPTDFTCVFQLQLTWRPVCPVTGPCTMPAIIVGGQVVVKPTFGGKVLINTQEYTFQKGLR